MGVDFYACGICGDTFPDCGEYGTCAGCEEMLCTTCHEEQVKKYGTPEEGSDAEAYFGEEAANECDLCSSKVIRDADILDYLLERTGLSKEEVVQIVKDHRGIKSKETKHILKCPECGSDQVNQFRSPMGEIWCGVCNFKVPHKEIENPFVHEVPQ